MLKRINVLIVPFFITACAALDPKPPEVIVAERAQQRADLLMARDYEASYAFTTPGYRTTEGVGRYGTRWAGASMWTAAKVTKVSCDELEPPTRCKAILRVDFKAVRVGGGSTSLQEDWIFTEGNWFLYQNF